MEKIKEFIAKIPQPIKVSIVSVLTATIAYVVNIFTNYADKLIALLQK